MSSLDDMTAALSFVVFMLSIMTLFTDCFTAYQAHIERCKLYERATLLAHQIAFLIKSGEAKLPEMPSDMHVRVTIYYDEGGGIIFRELYGKGIDNGKRIVTLFVVINETLAKIEVYLVRRET